MVNHKKSLESKCIPQWRHQYIEYGELNELLSKAVKQVHKLFEAHAVIIATQKEIAKKPEGSNLRSRRSSDSQSGSQIDSNPGNIAPVIVLDELDKHQKFEKQLVFELSKATRFYNNKILEIKFEIVNLLIVAMKIGLIDEFELASEVAGNYDPGSTIGILTREMKGIEVVLSNQRNPLKERRNSMSSEDGEENKSLLANEEQRTQDVPNTKMLFAAAKSSSSCFVDVHDIRRRLIEEWLMTTSSTLCSHCDNEEQMPPHLCDELRQGKNAAKEPILIKEWKEFKQQSPHIKSVLIGEFKRDMLEFYRELLLVLEFGDQNGITVQKIMKKHRKELGGHIMRSVAIHGSLRECPFFNDGEQHGIGSQLLLKHLISQTEALYISAFSKEFSGPAKDRKKAGMKELAGFTQDGKDSEWLTLFESWRFGATVGAAAILIIVLLYMSTFPTINTSCSECEDVIVGLYRLTGMAIAFAWMWAVVSTVVISVRIDYSMVLQYDPRVLGKASASFFDGLCAFSICWLVALSFTMLYLKAAPHWNQLAPLPVYPIMLFLTGISTVIWHERSTGGWFFQAVKRIVTAPCYIVTFREIFLADQFTSLVIILRDFLFMGCFIAQGSISNKSINDGSICIHKTDSLKPLFASLPSWWRLLQCLRRYRDSCKPNRSYLGWIMSGDKTHLYNAIKYSITFPIITLSTLSANTTNAELKLMYDIGWWCFAATDVTYKCYWDFIHDWGLGSMEMKFLRPRLKAKVGDVEFLRPMEANHLYPVRAYYVAIALNICMRSTSPLLVTSDFLGTSTGSTCIALLEVVRRGMWNLFRLENRHLTHCVQQRARLMGRLGHFDRRLMKYENKIHKSGLYDQNSDEACRMSPTIQGEQAEAPPVSEKALEMGLLGHELPPFLSDEWLNVMLEKAQEHEDQKLETLKTSYRSKSPPSSENAPNSPSRPILQASSSLEAFFEAGLDTPPSHDTEMKVQKTRADGPVLHDVL